MTHIPKHPLTTSTVSSEHKVTASDYSSVGADTSLEPRKDLSNRSAQAGEETN